MNRAQRAAWLEEQYRRFNHRRFIAPDPLELALEQADPGEGEIAGFLAASLAYGRVASILASARGVVARMGGRPRAFLLGTRPADWPDAARGFVHRWSDAADMVELWLGLRRVLERHGSLAAAYRLGWSPGQETVLPALAGLTRELGVRNSLVADPEGGGAAKRLHMFLRWMIRRDEVDPGLWTGFPARQLLMPLDVHSFAQCRRLRLTRRGQPDLRAVLEVTRSLAALRPDDPVRYDFALSRLGIRATARLAALDGQPLP